MRRQKPLDKETGCARCPAYGGCEGLDVTVRNLTRLPSQRKIRAPGSAADIVLTSAGKETFLVRRRKNPPPDQCPLLGYEVRRIDGDDRPRRKPDPTKAKAPSGHPEGREACRELLMLALAGLI